MLREHYPEGYHAYSVAPSQVVRQRLIPAVEHPFHCQKGAAIVLKGVALTVEVAEPAYLVDNLCPLLCGELAVQPVDQKAALQTVEEQEDTPHINLRVVAATSKPLQVPATTAC